MFEISNGDTILKAAPIAGTATADIFGLSVNEWFYVAMIIYMIIMAVNDFLDKKSARKLRELEASRDPNNPPNQNGTGGNTP